MDIRFLFVLAALLGSASGLAAEDLSLRLSGSNTLGARLGPALAEAFARERGYTDAARREKAAQEYVIEGTAADGGRFRAEVRAHGTGTGLAELLGGQADIWMASRLVSQDEVQRAETIGALRAPAQEHVVGLDGLAIIVHPGNGLREIRIEQLRAAFAGELRDWAQLGGKPGPIRLYGRDEKSGTFDTFRSLVLGDLPIAAQAARLESSADLEQRVAADPAALGFVGASYVAGSRALAVRGAARALAPDALGISTEEYPLARRLYFYTRRDAGPVVQAFVEYAQSARGQAVVAENGFVAQRIFIADAEPLPDQPEGYYEVTDNAERASLNFRFRPASSTLDARALRDIDRLGEFMQQPQYRGREVRLAAFSYGQSLSPAMALITLNDRVDHLTQMLAARGVVLGASRGFVETAPGAVSGDERVEVWIGAASGDTPL